MTSHKQSTESWLIGFGIAPQLMSNAAKIAHSHGQLPPNDEFENIDCSLSAAAAAAKDLCPKKYLNHYHHNHHHQQDHRRLPQMWLTLINLTLTFGAQRWFVSWLNLNKCTEKNFINWKQVTHSLKLHYHINGKCNYSYFTYNISTFCKVQQKLW